MVEQQDTQSVSAHYTDGDLGEKILGALRATGKDPDALTMDDLTPVDQFHLGGKPATLALIERAGLRPGMRVLDVGGGLGGPARTLATAANCTVTVLDLSAEFCQVGRMLTARVGMSDRVTFQHGSALAMPFADGEFDAVWTQHATMNIADKGRLYAEISRVLRPGGRLAMHDAMAGPVQPIYFPVPWARDPTISFLCSSAAVRALLVGIGFREIEWVDEREKIVAILRRQVSILALNGPPPLGMQLLIGTQFPEILGNVARNLEEDRLTIIQAVFERP
ncbi:MAG: methyltransferase domain-containing protein [Thermomicrobia bacterium]|nr:methyltransferase domain-containing protein [Thermomicrobia bacterium]